MGLKLIKPGINLIKDEEWYPEQNAKERNKREGKIEKLKDKYNLMDYWIKSNNLQKEILDAKKKKHIRKYNDLLFIRDQFDKNNSLKPLRKYSIPGITVIENYDYEIGISCYEDLEDQSKEPYQVQVFILVNPGIEKAKENIDIISFKIVHDIDFKNFKFNSYEPKWSDYKNYDAYDRARERYNYRKKKAWEKAKETEEKRIYNIKAKRREEGQKIKTRLESFDYYIYQNNLYSFNKSDSYSEQEKKLLIKEHYFKQEKKFQRLQKEVKLFEKLESMEKSEYQQSREPIPEEVRFAVWRRDSGKCVKCGSNEKLEFDHIIPVSKGGSNTERNIQLLCEKCNREKSDKI